MNKRKIGLLPLYLKLYDDFFPELRERMDAFYSLIADELGQRDLEVFTSEVCRIKKEFTAAIQHFETNNVDAVVTLHLAYSPSLEAIDALTASRLPIIVLDTTPAFDYSPGQHPDELMFNHGIHGVQDLCNLLLRNERSFVIEAGHWSESDVLDRVAETVKAAKIAKSLTTAKVGAIGRPFDGMGDFAVPVDILRSAIGIETVEVELDPAAACFDEIDAASIEQEMLEDAASFDISGLDVSVHRKSTGANLSVRKLIKEKELTAFTVNFMEITNESGISSMPFLEASKSMAAGIGYAGEGDVLTAALAGALLSVYPESSFTEMFCPDWRNDRIFLSHMGEMNIRLSAQKPLLREKEFPFTNADNPVVAYGRFRAGHAVFVNAAPGKHHAFSLILSPIEMVEIQGEDRMSESVRGWFTPPVSVADFLTAYSKQGGTHHGVIVYGDVLQTLKKFGELMGWHTIVIK